MFNLALKNIPATLCLRLKVRAETNRRNLNREILPLPARAEAQRRDFANPTPRSHSASARRRSSCSRTASSLIRSSWRFDRSVSSDTARITRCIVIHHPARNLQPPCSIPSSGCASRHTGAARRLVMEIAGLVMLVSNYSGRQWSFVYQVNRSHSLRKACRSWRRSRVQGSR